MPTQKKRNKSAAAVTTDMTTSAATSEAMTDYNEDMLPVIDAEIVRTDFVKPQRPSWVDGVPVTTEGRPIREKFQQPQKFMEGSEEKDQSPPEESGEDNQPQGKSWGEPYKAIFNCPEMKFELGENRRFKQRVFKFSEKPSAEILDALKEHGFIYRAVEKAWTIAANPDTRKLTDELAREWAGPNYVRSIER